MIEKKSHGCRYVDTHCHIDFADFDVDRDDVIAACQQADISHLIIPGVEPAQWDIAKKMSEKFSAVYFSMGIHPWWISTLAQNNYRLDQFRQDSSLLDHPRCLAVGECGLDGAIATAFELQIPYFKYQMALAKEYQRPIIIHSHRANNEMIRLLKYYRLEKGGVIHGFCGSLELAQQYWAMGFYLGVGGVITYGRAKKTQATFSRMPLASLLLETDAPDMPLNGRQGQRNSPLAIIDIASSLAALQGTTIATVAMQTSHNAEALFGVPLGN